MIGVLVQLQGMTLKGQLLRSLRLLRQPKYLIGFVVGSAWIGMWLLRPALHGRVVVGGPEWSRASGSLGPIFHQLAALMLTVFTPLAWLLPWGRLGLPFRESELTLLLQAPLTRRQVMQYGLLKSETGVIVSALAISTFVVGRGALGWLPGFAGTWILFELLHLISKGRALFNLRQTELPAARARARRTALTTVLVAFYTLLIVAGIQLSGRIGAALAGTNAEQVIGRLAGVHPPPLLAALAAPAWWLTVPMFATSWAQFFLPALCGIIALLATRELVLRSKARFEEPSLAHAQEQETRKVPGRRFTGKPARARERRPFELRPEGLPELALVWKNAIRVSRTPWRWLLFAATIFLLALCAIPAVLRLSEAVYYLPVGIGIFLMFMLPLLGGMMWNHDLSTELRHLEIVRTWPVSVRRFVLTQAAFPALISFFGATLGAGMVVACMLGSQWRQTLTGHASELRVVPQSGLLGVGNVVALFLLVASFLPVSAIMAFVSCALQNLATLFAPAWLSSGTDRGHGIATLGQRLVFSTLLSLTLVVAWIPGLLLLGAALLAQKFLAVPWSAWEIPFWAALAALPTAAVGVVVVNVSALLWSRLDPSEEMLEAGR